MKTILAAGALALALMLAAVSAVSAKTPPPPADEGIMQPVVVGE
ncbi:MAG: hypothetical protein ACKVP7_20155 [Hyphomicrobiaceae bacterium]